MPGLFETVFGTAKKGALTRFDPRTGVEWFGPGTSGQLVAYGSDLVPAPTSLANLTSGTWTAVAFDAANFTADSGNWTLASGDQTNFAYLLIGKTMVVTFNFNTTTISATPNQLLVKIPASKTCAKRADTTILIANNGTEDWGQALVTASGTNIGLLVKGGVANWQASTDNAYVRGTIAFEVQ